jgi:hypothetical protein
VSSAASVVYTRLGEKGFIFKNDRGSFPSRVHQLTKNDSLLARLGDGAVQFVRSHGTDEMTDQVLDVYRKVLRPTAGPAAHTPVTSSVTQGGFIR